MLSGIWQHPFIDQSGPRYLQKKQQPGKFKHQFVVKDLRLFLKDVRFVVKNRLLFLKNVR